MRDLDHEAHENFARFCRLDYLLFEVVFAVPDVSDPAIAILEKLLADFPTTSIRLIANVPNVGTSDKVNNPCQLAQNVRYGLLVMSNTDVRVETDYLKQGGTPSRHDNPPRPAESYTLPCGLRKAGQFHSVANKRNWCTMLPFSRSKRKFRFITSREKCAIHFSVGPGQNQMRVRNLTLFSLMLACLTHPAVSLGQDSNSDPPDEILRESKPTDFNRSIYYKNKLEFSLETGWLPNNIPWPFDFLLGDKYNVTPLKYTLVPNIASLRWQIGNIAGPGILRGNWDLAFSGAFTAIPRGPETHYEAFDMGIRRNFVRRNWRTAPYFDLRLGVGGIDAKGPKGVPYAQGQDLTFTFMLGSGVRCNFNPRYSISAGIHFMDVSNLYLSEPKFLNYGINVYGPVVGSISG